MITVDVFVLLLQLLSEVVEDSGGHADVGISSLESSGPILGGALGEESGVTVPGSSDVAFPAIRADSHVDPFCLGGVISVILTKNEFRSNRIVRSHLEGEFVIVDLSKRHGSGQEATRLVVNCVISLHSETKNAVGSIRFFVENLLPISSLDLFYHVELLIV